MTQWTTADIPLQQGRLVIITGGTEGLGYEDALAIARAGGDVIVASRNADKGAIAVARMRSEFPDAKVRFEQLDLASQASIASFAERMRAQLPRLDLLINNAGIMAPPRRLTTADGFELQFGINFLGHFALTARLMPLLRKGHQARVVTMSSFANRSGTINFDDLQSEGRYRAWQAYSQSKLADLMFAFELQSRSAAAEWSVASLAAHPGLTRSNLISSGPGRNSAIGLLRRLTGPVMFQPASQGALPALFAATSPHAEAGAYYGPDRMRELRGNVKLATVPAKARDRQATVRLWNVAEQLTGVSYA